MSSAISIETVTKTFNNQIALKSLTLDIPSGTSIALIGPAASGKSVLMKCILGLMVIDSGVIRIDGELNSRRLTNLDKIGVMFQENALFDSLTVWQNIAFRLINKSGISEQKAKNIALEKLSSVGLSTDTAYKYPAELSGGMQKRVALARALLHEPRILILDEPTAGLDPILTNVICNLITQSTQHADTTALVITSDMKVARENFDRIAYIENGEINWSGPTNTAKTNASIAAKKFLYGSSIA